MFRWYVRQYINGSPVGRKDRPSERKEHMKFTATFWRSNPQLKSGGYWTERTIEAKTVGQARKKAYEIEKKCLYGSMTLKSIKRSEQ